MVVLQEPGSELRPREVIDNPPQDLLRQLTLQMPNTRRTSLGSVDVLTRVDARSSASTYIVTDDPGAHRGHLTMTRAEYESIARLQDEYVADQAMIVIDGYIANGEEVQTSARLVVERANANIAGMQKCLYFERAGGEAELTIIDTPNLSAAGYPNERCIAVDLEHGVTRVLNSDYFGESKKGGLRMWNKIVYDKGGLPMHAGCKVIPTKIGPKTVVTVGLSGTGKTTTTFRRQGDSKAVQDDFIALMPGGKVYGTENGCFAKTFGLSPRHEPEINQAVTSPTAYLENVYLDEDGTPDFFNESFTQNGRAVFPLEALGRYEDARAIGPVDAIVILNRARSVVPALAKLSQQQAAAYFMLGETQGTSAGGKDEAGKALRVPGTNPFFPLPQELQGNRFLELLGSHLIEVYLMNTGWIVDDTGPASKKVTVEHSSACVQAIAEGGLEWVEDPDFGYQVPVSVPGIAPEDSDLLHPRERFAALGRMDDYDGWVEKLKAERSAFLDGFPGLDSYIRTGI